MTLTLLNYRRFGTWGIPVGETTTDQVDQAISVGFSHIGTYVCVYTWHYLYPQVCRLLIPTLAHHIPDTAQAYFNEAEAGKAIRDSGLKREEIFVTTKYSGVRGLDMDTSVQDSLNKVSSGYGVFFRETKDEPALKFWRGPSLSSFPSTPLTFHSSFPFVSTVRPHLHRPLSHPLPAARQTRYPNFVGQDGGVEG